MSRCTVFWISLFLSTSASLEVYEELIDKSAGGGLANTSEDIFHLDTFFSQAINLSRIMTANRSHREGLVKRDTNIHIEDGGHGGKLPQFSMVIYI